MTGGVLGKIAMRSGKLLTNAYRAKKRNSAVKKEIAENNGTKSGAEGASGSVKTDKGNTFSGNSTGSSATGGSPRAPMNPKVQEALDIVKNPSRSHGACCEIDAFNKALNAGDSLKGAKMGPVTLNKNRRVLGPCVAVRINIVRLSKLNIIRFGYFMMFLPIYYRMFFSLSQIKITRFTKLHHNNYHHKI